MENRQSGDQTTLPVAPWQHWKCILDGYRHPINLSDLEGQWRLLGNLKKGDRTETIEFENSFREQAPHHLEPWFEVVFWRLYGDKQASERAKVIIDTLKRRGILAQDLWGACCQFIDNPGERRFKAFQKLIVAGRHIDVAVSFPAFIAPDRFPMVDGQIAKWVRKNHEAHNMFAQDTGRLLPPTYFDLAKDLSLTIFDYPFYEQWIPWCQLKSKQLTELSGSQWRARDVEVAVSTAQRTGLELPPVTVEQSFKAQG
jgi:hypothetical protein